MTEQDRIFADDEKRMVRQIAEIYKRAQIDISRKMKDWNKRHAVKDAEMRARVEAGEITEAAYKKWLRTEVYVGKQWQGKLDEISGVLVHADKEAAKVINRSTAAVFADSANYTAYEIQANVGAVGNLAIYDGATVRRLISRSVLPERVIDTGADALWQSRSVQNAVLQGIIQGESIPEISRRIATETGIKAGKATTRSARTAVTSAQNAGRQERMEEAEEELSEDGIEVRKMWRATLDDRTRDAHQELDGETIPVDESFHNSIGDIKYPGDPAADDANVYNCRCTLETVYPSIPVSRQRRAYHWVERPDGTKHRESYLVGDITYKEWLERQKEGR